jgi:phosphoglycerate dehydrogenase-like enzyme
MKVVVSARNFFFDGCGGGAAACCGFEVCDITNKPIADEAAYYAEIRDADAVINAFEPMSRALLEKCGNLKLISRSRRRLRLY